MTEKGLMDRVLELITSSLKRQLSLVLCVSALGLAGNFGFAQSLEELDRIVTRAPDLETFLSHPEWVDDYFVALQNYYGPERFPRASFDAILGQLRQTVQKIPELKVRLWETNGLGTPFSIQAPLRGYGRGLDAEKWNSYLNQWFTQLFEKSRPIPSGNSESRREMLMSLTREIASDIEKFNATLVGLKKAERESRRAGFFKDLRRSEKVQRVASALLHRKLRSPAVIDLLLAGDSDLILQSMDDLKQGLGSKSGSEWEEVPQSVLSFVKDLVPDKKQLLERSDLFPVVTQLTRDGKHVPTGVVSSAPIEFRPLPRRIHGIWKGIPIRECVGGDCSRLADLTPERWAVIALQDTQLHSVEQGGRSIGFVQQTPVKIGEHVYATVDFGAPILNRSVVIQKPSQNAVKRTTLFEYWLKEAERTKPKAWRGLLVGEDSAINNAKVLNTVWNSNAYIFGKEVTKASELNHLDPLASKLVAVSPVTSLPYSGNMIFEGTTLHSGTLQRLVVLNSELNIEGILKSPEKRNTAMARGSAAMKRALLEAWRKQTDLPELNRMRLIELLDHADPFWRWVAVEKSGDLAKDPEVLSVLMRSLSSDSVSEVREAIASRLGTLELEEPNVKSALARALNDVSPEVRVEAARALRSVPPKTDEIYRALAGALQDSNALVRGHAAVALSTYPSEDPQIHQALLLVLGDRLPEVRGFAANALGKGKPAELSTQMAVAKLLHDPSPFVRKKATYAFAYGIESSELSIHRSIVQLVHDRDPEIRQAALSALERQEVSDRGIGLEIIGAVNDSEAEVRSAALSALEEVGAKAKLSAEEISTALFKGFEDSNAGVRLTALNSLARLKPGDPKTRSIVLRALKDPAYRVRWDAALIIPKLATVDSEILSALNTLLNDENEYVRSSARNSIDKIEQRKNQVSVPSGCLSSALQQSR